MFLHYTVDDGNDFNGFNNVVTTVAPRDKAAIVRKRLLHPSLAISGFIPKIPATEADANEVYKIPYIIAPFFAPKIFCAAGGINAKFPANKKYTIENATMKVVLE